ncbi:14778_t:CDS:2, partial [Racocetra persica]
YCNLEKNNYETPVNNSISSIDEISLTSNENETMVNFNSIINDAYIDLQVQRILDELKVFHNR